MTDRAFVIVKTDFEYNDEYYNPFDGSGISGIPTVAYKTRQHAEQALQAKIIEWLRKDEDPMIMEIGEDGPFSDDDAVRELLGGATVNTTKPCDECGKNFRAGDRYCSHCGERRCNEINLEAGYKLGLCEYDDEVLEKLSKHLTFKPFKIVEIDLHS